MTICYKPFHYYTRT